MVVQISSAWHSYRNLEDELVSAIVRCQGIENGWELFRIKFDWNILSVPIFNVLPTMTEPGSLCRRAEKSFSHTIDDGTDDLIDLALLCGIGRCETSCESRCE